MNSFKIILVTLLLMTSSSFADFTIKDLFVSGGTQSQDADQDTKSKEKKERTHQDCV